MEPCLDGAGPFCGVASDNLPHRTIIGELQPKPANFQFEVFFPFSHDFNNWGQMNRSFAPPLIFITLMLVSISGLPSETRNEREAKQAELDAICEATRQENLTRVRAEYVEECIEKKQRPDRESCERFYADYGESAGGNQVPLFYDLPECVKADEYRRSYRNPSR